VIRRTQLILACVLFLSGCWPQTQRATSQSTTVRHESPEQAMHAYFKSFEVLDLQVLSTFYADEVKVYKGATILDKRYGGLGGESGRSATKVVTREQLIKAYEKAILSRGGFDQWRDRARTWGIADTVAIRATDPTNRAAFSKLGVPLDAVIIIAHPKKDSAVYVWKAGGVHGWSIIAEGWD